MIAAACGDDGDTDRRALAAGRSDRYVRSGEAGRSRSAGSRRSRSSRESKTAINARIARENKTCIQGRKLEFVGIKDDGSDPQKNLDLSKSLVESDKVFAMINTRAVMLPQTTNYLADKKVPFFGWGFMPGFCGDDSWGYGFNGCLSGYAFDRARRLTSPTPSSTARSIDPIAEHGQASPPTRCRSSDFNSDDDSGTSASSSTRRCSEHVLAKPSSCPSRASPTSRSTSTS